MNENSCVAATIKSFLVAFIDLTGYTRLARQNAPEAVYELLSQYYELVGDMVSRKGGA